MNSACEHLKSMQLDAVGIAFLEDLNPTLKSWGGRTFVKVDEVEGVALKEIISRVETICQNPESLSANQTEIAQKMVHSIRELHYSDIECPKWKSFLTWIRSFFGNLGEESHESRLFNIEKSLKVIRTPPAQNRANEDHPPSLPQNGYFFPEIPFRSSDIKQSIAANVSLLLYGGITRTEAENFRNLPLVGIDEECLSIGFADENYARRLYHALHDTGFTTTEFETLNINLSYIKEKHCIRIYNPLEVAVFLRDLCQQELNSIGKWLVDENFFNSDFGELLLYFLNSNRPDGYLIPKTPQTYLFYPELEICNPDLSKIVGALTTLLRPGGNTLQKAIDMDDIADVEIGEDDKLSMIFINRNYTKDLHRTLEELGYSSITYEEVNVESNEMIDSSWDVTERGKLLIESPEEITRFLIEICKLNPTQVLLLLRQQGKHESELAAEIDEAMEMMNLFESQPPLGPEMKLSDKEIDENRYKINRQKMFAKPIPPLPAQAEMLDCDDMVRISLELNVTQPDKEGYLDPATILIDDHGSSESLEHLPLLIEKYWKVAKGKVPHLMGMPNNVADRDKFTGDLLLLLKHITFLLPNVNPFTQALILLPLAIGSNHCAGRYMQEAIRAFQLLKGFSSNPIYLDQDLPEDFSLNEQQLHSYLEKFLEEKRIQALERVISKIYHDAFEHHGSVDIVHVRNYYMRLIGKDLGIPGYEAASYNDIYQNLAARGITRSQFKKRFFSYYNPQTMISDVAKLITIEAQEENSAQIKRIRAEVRDAAQEFFKMHAPEEYENSKSDFLEKIYPDYIHPERKFVSQMLEYFQFIK